ncbi:MAG: glutamate formimidoyltransferase [Prevotellaceae bacterium]|jgi:glutamate formiminotransferase/formiminotetrahydrofolate cyclodeaminase|nr:glutamate formimidoyltransferase [Prevotellaceae bacterium]
MNEQTVECVPNFSEGGDTTKIRKILDSIETTSGVRLLHVDRGMDAGRTVVTFAGSPLAVCDAAFKAIRTASEIIDMRLHRGKHPRIGSADVCPLIPLRGIDMKTVVELARKLAERVGTELDIPVYCYEHAAFVPERRSLAFCRRGGYEALPEKLAAQKPDFGPSEFSERVAATGAAIVGAREPLIAVNFNLDTDSKAAASRIAAEIRESGNGMKGVRAIGWYIADFGIAQVSVNLIDIAAAPLHNVFEEVIKRAALQNIKVCGTEIVGLIPEKVLSDAGKYFAAKRQSLKTDKETCCFDNKRYVEIAVREMGLDALSPFDVNERILEYVAFKTDE